MYNWNTDTTELKKDKDKYIKWKLEQLINFGLDGEKLSRKELIKYWSLLEIDPESRGYLEFLLWKNKPQKTS